MALSLRDYPKTVDRVLLFTLAAASGLLLIPFLPSGNPALVVFGGIGYFGALAFVSTGLGLYIAHRQHVPLMGKVLLATGLFGMLLIVALAQIISLKTMPTFFAVNLVLLRVLQAGLAYGLILSSYGWTYWFTSGPMSNGLSQPASSVFEFYSWLAFSLSIVAFFGIGFVSTAAPPRLPRIPAFVAILFLIAVTGSIATIQRVRRIHDSKRTAR